MMGSGDIPPRTFAGRPLDEFERMQLLADMDRRRRDRMRKASAETALTAARIQEHSESDERHLEGER